MCGTYLSHLSCSFLWLVFSRFPTADRRPTASIPEIFQTLCEELALTRPDDPLAYMAHSFASAQYLGTWSDEPVIALPMAIYANHDCIFHTHITDFFRVENQRCISYLSRKNVKILIQHLYFSRRYYPPSSDIGLRLGGRAVHGDRRRGRSAHVCAVRAVDFRRRHAALCEWRRFWRQRW